MGSGVAGRGHRLDDRVAELDDVAVGQSDVLEVDPSAGWEVGRRPGSIDQRREARDVVGLNVRLEDRDDRNPLRLRQPDVVVDEIGVGIDDGEAAPRLAPEEIGGTGRLVVQELAEEHGLTNYQLIY